MAVCPRPVRLLADVKLPGRIAARVTKWNETETGASYPVFKPRIQFDHILSDGIAGSRGTVHALPVSDHCAITAQFAL